MKSGSIGRQNDAPQVDEIIFGAVAAPDRAGYNISFDGMPGKSSLRENFLPEGTKSVSAIVVPPLNRMLMIPTSLKEPLDVHVENRIPYVYQSSFCRNRKICVVRNDAGSFGRFRLGMYYGRGPA